MKILFLLISLFIIGNNSTNAQNISVKDDKILYNDSAILKYKKLDEAEFSIFTTQGDEIIYSKFHNNETPRNYEDDYVVINFLVEKKKIESFKDEMIISGFGGNYKKNLIKFINWLINEKVLNVDGSVNKDRVDIFYEKYNENISIRTIRKN